MTIEKIGVVGAGLMGAEIAMVMALSGHAVAMVDLDGARLEAALARLASLFDKGIPRGFYTEDDKARALNAISPESDLLALADRDLVIEAVFEDEADKASVFATLDRACAPACIFASNTSSIPISALAGHVAPERRTRFLGTHFFSPVSRMKLVEVIAGFDTDPAVVETVLALCRKAGKEPIRVKDVVGFAVNRMLHAMIVEAVRLVEEGVSTPAEIDTACRLGLGHAMGPFELMDLVTNHLSLQVGDILHEAYGPRFLPRPLLRQMVQAGYDGRAAGRGWYRYRDGKRIEE